MPSKEAEKNDALLESILRKSIKGTDGTTTSSSSVGDTAVQILNSLVENKSITLDQVKEIIMSSEEKQKQKMLSTNKSNNGDGGNTANKRIRKKAKKAKKQNRNYITRHIAFRFHYDGATYNGLAENRNDEKDNSVEKVLFSALEKTCLVDLEEKEQGRTGGGNEEKGTGIEGILIEQGGDNSEEGNPIASDASLSTNKNSRKECKYSRSGRTDKGVSAFGQVVALRVRSAFPTGAMIPRNNTTLDCNDSENKMNPKDMTIMQESDLPKNSLEEICCWVPQSLKKKQQQGHEKKDSISTESNSEITNFPLKQRTITEKNYCQILNNVLPPTVRMLGWSPVSQKFSARFSTSYRTYRYFFIQRDLNLDHMQEALSYMVGRHDFRNVCKMNCEEVDNFVRVINYAKIVKTSLDSPNGRFLDSEGNNTTAQDTGGTEGDHQNQQYRRPCYLEIQGQAFLWHQIRCIASIMFMVGKGIESPTIVKELLDIATNPAKPSYPFAPELPLVLHKCGYKNLNFGHSVQNLWRVSCDLEKKWEELTLAAQRLQNGLDSLETESVVATRDVVQFINSFVAERKKKIERNCSLMNTNQVELSTVDSSELIKSVGSHIPWTKALTIMSKCGVGRPGVDGPKAPLHLPLMMRAKGTTYEEKVKAILATDSKKEGGPPSKRRREVYENNVRKRKLSKKEDDAFYQQMLSEGGSGL